MTATEPHRRGPNSRRRSGPRWRPAPAGGRRAGRPARLAKRRHAVGTGRHARGRKPPRLADDRRADARRAGLAEQFAAASHATACTMSCCWAWAAPRSRPEVLRRCFDDSPERRRRAARARLDRRRERSPRCRRDRPRAHAVPRLLEVGRHDRAAVPVRALLLAVADGQPFVGRHRSRLGPGATRRGAHFPACSPATPTSADATARCRRSESSRPR